MIPIRDNIPSRRFPVMNVVLIGINVIMFLYEVSLAVPEREAFLRVYGMIPRQVTGIFATEAVSLGDFGSVFTAMFLHGSWMHIIGNMLFLWVFGDNVEDIVGSWRYLLLYLLAGAVGNFAHVITNPASALPTIGASGAVAGILGAYLVNFAHARVVTLIPLGIFLTTVELPALFFLLFWFVLQLISGFASLGVESVGGVAWWAHIGGFLAGVLLVRFLRERRYERW